MTFMGGILLIIPGLFSGALGLVLVFPPTRALARLTLGLILFRVLRRQVRFRVAQDQGEVIDVEFEREVSSAQQELGRGPGVAKKDFDSI